jgi:thiol-disulfide isomerase/thioredoxin
MKYAILLIAIFLAACTTVDTQEVTTGMPEEQNDDMNDNSQEVSQEDTMNEEEMNSGTNEAVEEKNQGGWINTELTDVNSGETYMLSGFEGKKVIVENFAVWCPTCTRQQEILRDSEKMENVVHVNIGADPNEDEDKIREHAQKNGFDWRYSVAPSEFTQALIDEFGLGIVNAPRVPMILICEDLTYRQLPGGLKSEDDLNEEIAKGCNA